MDEFEALCEREMVADTVERRLDEAGAASFTTLAEELEVAEEVLRDAAARLERQELAVVEGDRIEPA